jgi:hypothetical protein
VFFTKLRCIQPEPPLFKLSLNAIGECIALGRGETREHEFHHPVIGIHERKRGSIGFLPQTEMKARRLDHAVTQLTIPASF